MVMFGTWDHFSHGVILSLSLTRLCITEEGRTLLCFTSLLLVQTQPQLRAIPKNWTHPHYASLILLSSLLSIMFSSSKENLHFWSNTFISTFSVLKFCWSQILNNTIFSQIISITLTFALKQKLHSFSMTLVLHMYLNKYIFSHRQDHFVINTGAKCWNVGTFYPLCYCKESH